MLQLSEEKFKALITVLEESDKAFVGDIQRDVVAQAQADIFFQLGFQAGTYSYDKAFGLWKDVSKRTVEGMYRAGAATVGNPFYKELKIPGRDLRLMSRYMRREGRFFKGLLSDIRDPKHVPIIPTDAAGKRLPGYKLQRFDYLTRAGMYPESLEAMRYNGMLMGAGRNIEIRWVLGVPMTEHCIDCPTLAMRVWLPETLPTVPRAGDTKCLWKCYCHLEPRQRFMRTTFDIAGRATEGAIRAFGRNARVYDTAGQEIGGQLQREIEFWQAQEYKARQMMSIAPKAERMFWIGERKRFNRLIIDRAKAGSYRVVPTVSVSALTKTIKAAAAKGGTLTTIEKLMVGDEVWFARSDYSSFGVIGIRNGVKVFKSPTGVVLNLDDVTDIIFAAGKSDKFFMNQFAEAVKAGKGAGAALHEVFGTKLQNDLWYDLTRDWTMGTGPLGARGIIKGFAEEIFGVANYQRILSSKKLLDRLFLKMARAWDYKGSRSVLAENFKEVLRKAKACAYEHLRTKYPKGYVTLYRGVSREEFGRVYKSIRGRRAMNSDSLSGFTSNLEKARNFADIYGGYVVKCQVSIDNILSSPGFKFSDFITEQEWLVLGKDGLTKMIKIVDFGIPDPVKEAVVKWGKLYPKDVGLK